MTARCLAIGSLALLIAAGCAKKSPPVMATPTPRVSLPAAAPPQPQNIFALLPDPEGRNSAIVVSNAGGQQEIARPNQAVRISDTATAPTAPFSLDPPAVRRLFGVALNVLPAAEVRFVLSFDVAQAGPNAVSRAQLPDILRAIQERRSTNITVTGHTDTTGDSASNYQLGLQRAQTVAAILQTEGVVPSHLFVTSHGDADLLVKTPRGQDEPQNRRVEVIVR